MKNKSHKRLSVITILLAATMLAILSGCSVSTASYNLGIVERRSFEVSDFTAIETSLPFRITWQESTETTVTIEMHENLFSRISVTENNGTLVIRPNRTIVGSHNQWESPRLYITSPYIAGITAYGAIRVENWDTVVADSFSLDLNGGATINLDLEVENLDINVNGGSSITLSGTATSTDISLAGGINLSALALETQDTSIDIVGSGNIYITAYNTLNVTATGAARVRYGGNPNVTRRIIGAGTVRRA